MFAFFYNYRERILFAVFFVYGLAIQNFNTTDISLIIISVIALFYILHVQNQEIDFILVKILVYWSIVNLLSFIFIGSSTFDISTFVGSVLKIFIGYSIAKIFGFNFIYLFERVVFILVLVSVPFFAIQLYNHELFDSIPFNLAFEGRRIIGDWNGIIFNYADGHKLQNSGFAGEPGTFGYYIGLAMIFNLILNDGKFTKKLLVFVLIGLTTFSTNFYLTLILFALYFIWRLPSNYRILAFIVFIPLAIYFYKLPFVGNKINEYISHTEYFYSTKIVKSDRINRFAAFTSHLKDIVKYPFGYGVNKTALSTNIYGRVITGTNDFSSIAVRFGVFGFVFFVLTFNSFFRQLFQKNDGYILLMLILFMYMAANSLERDYFIFSFFWLYLISKMDSSISVNVSKNRTLAIDDMKNI